MHDIRCKIPEVSNPYFIAAFIKSVDVGQDLVKYLKADRRGVKSLEFRKTCEARFYQFHSLYPVDLSSIENFFNVEFCILKKALMKKTGENRKTALRIENIPSFCKPVVFIVLSRKDANKGYGAKVFYS